MTPVQSTGTSGPCGEQLIRADVDPGRCGRARPFTSTSTGAPSPFVPVLLGCTGGASVWRGVVGRHDVVLSEVGIVAAGRHLEWTCSGD